MRTLVIGSVNTEPLQNPQAEKFVLWPLNTVALILYDVQDVVPGSDPPTLAPIGDAILLATLLDGQSNPVPGMTNLPFTALGSPPTGDYVAYVPPTFDPPLGGDYLLQIIGGEGSPPDLNLEILVEVVNRED